MIRRVREWCRRHLRKVGARLNSLLHPTKVDWAELFFDSALVWQASRLCHAAAPAPASGGTASGAALIAAGNSFLVSQVDTGACAALLLAAGLLGAWAWLEEWTALRLAAQTVGVAWWLFIGYLLMTRTPGHAGGGLQILMGLFAIGVYSLLCVQLDRERQAMGAARALGETAVREALPTSP